MLLFYRPSYCWWLGTAVGGRWLTSCWIPVPLRVLVARRRESKTVHPWPRHVRNLFQIFLTETLIVRFLFTFVQDQRRKADASDGVQVRRYLWRCHINCPHSDREPLRCWPIQHIHTPDRLCPGNLLLLHTCWDCCQLQWYDARASLRNPKCKIASNSRSRCHCEFDPSDCAAVAEYTARFLPEPAGQTVGWTGSNWT